MNKDKTIPRPASTVVLSVAPAFSRIRLHKGVWGPVGIRG
jgi:hypothetical protein